MGAFQRLFSSPDVWTDLAASGQELLYGFALAAAVGIAAGLAIGWYPRVGYFVDPFVSFLYAVPRVALGPLLVVWLGIGLSSKVALVFLISVFPVLVNTSSGIRSLDPNLVRVAQCFGAGDLKIFRTIALPGTVPFILGGLRLAVGQSLIGVFVAELLGAQFGIGAMVENAGEQFQTDTVFAGLLIFAAAGMALTCDRARARASLRRLARLAWRNTMTLAHPRLAALLLAATCQALSAPQGAAAAEGAKLTISYSEKTVDFLPLLIANDAGYFKARGLDVTARYLPAREGVPALLAGEAQIAAIGGSDAVSAEAGGAKLKLVLTLTPTYVFQFWARPEYASGQALKGQRVGITSATGSLYAGTVLALEALGLKPSDVAITPLGSVTNVNNSLLAGSVAAAPRIPP